MLVWNVFIKNRRVNGRLPEPFRKVPSRSGKVAEPSGKVPGWLGKVPEPFRKVPRPFSKADGTTGKPPQPSRKVRERTVKAGDQTPRPSGSVNHHRGTDRANGAWLRLVRRFQSTILRLKNEQVRHCGMTLLILEAMKILAVYPIAICLVWVELHFHHTSLLVCIIFGFPDRFWR